MSDRTPKNLSAPMLDILLRLYRNKTMDWLEAQSAKQREMLKAMSNAGWMEQLDMYRFRITVLGIRRAREAIAKRPERLLKLDKKRGRPARKSASTHSPEQKEG